MSGTSNKAYTPHCFVCGAVDNLLKCSRCKESIYCGKQCQAKAWDYHEQLCNIHVVDKQQKGEFTHIPEGHLSLHPVSHKIMFIEGKKRPFYDADAFATEVPDPVEMPTPDDRLNDRTRTKRRRLITTPDPSDSDLQEQMDLVDRSALKLELGFIKDVSDTNQAFLLMIGQYDVILETKTECPNISTIEKSHAFERLFEVEHRYQIITTYLKNYTEAALEKDRTLRTSTENTNSEEIDLRLKSIETKILSNLASAKDAMFSVQSIITKRCTKYVVDDRPIYAYAPQIKTEVKGIDYLKNLQLRDKLTIQTESTIDTFIQTMQRLLNARHIVSLNFAAKICVGIIKAGEAAEWLYKQVKRTWAWATPDFYIITPTNQALVILASMVLGYFVVFPAIFAVAPYIGIAVGTFYSGGVAFAQAIIGYIMAALPVLCGILSFPGLGSFVKMKISNAVASTLLNHMPANIFGPSDPFKNDVYRMLRRYLPQLVTILIFVLITLGCAYATSTLPSASDFGIASWSTMTPTVGYVVAQTIFNSTSTPANINDWGIRAGPAIVNGRAFIVFREIDFYYAQIMDHDSLIGKIIMVQKHTMGPNGISEIPGTGYLTMANSDVRILSDYEVSGLSEEIKRNIFTEDNFDREFIETTLSTNLEKRDYLYKNAVRVRIALNIIMAFTTVVCIGAAATGLENINALAASMNSLSAAASIPLI